MDVSAAGAIAVFPILFFFFAIGCGLLGTIFWIWMLVDCAINEPSEGNDKIIWILIILFTHVIGALLYLLFRRSRRKEEFGR